MRSQTARRAPVAAKRVRLESPPRLADPVGDTPPFTLPHENSRGSARTLPLAGLIPAVAGALLVSLNGETSVDLGWHLETGRRILAGDGIPGPDPYLFTSGGAEWIDLHWLFQVLLAAVHGVAGFRGLVLLKAALVAGAIVLALRVPGPRRPSAALGALIGLLAAAVFSLRTGIRPEHLSYVLLAAEIVILESVRHGATPRRLFLLPLLQLVWTNSQGLFVLGIALQAAYVAGELAALRPAFLRPGDENPPYSGAARRTLFAAAALSIAAAFANPYGAAGALYPFLLATRLDPSDPLFQTIVELRPTLSFAAAPAATIAFLALLASSLAVVAARPLRAPSLTLAAAGLALVACGAYRNAPLLGIVALPLVLHGATPFLLARPRARLAAGVAAAALLATTAADAASPGIFGPFLAAERVAIPAAPSGERPEAAAAFLERTGGGERVFCDSSDASWLTWRLHGTRRFFMDTRTEVVGEDVFRAYHVVLQEPSRLFDAVAERHGIDAVLVDMNRPKMAPLLHHLLDSKAFALAFASEAEAVFLRRGAAASAAGLALAPGPEAARALRARFPLPPPVPR